LLRILAGLSRFGFDGEVSHREPCLFIGHHSAVKGLLTPRENLHWHPAGESFGDDAAIDAALAKVDLYGYEDVPSAQLSAGQQRRVNLARLYLSSGDCGCSMSPSLPLTYRALRACSSALSSTARTVALCC
jgi:heme exporter protein A